MACGDDIVPSPPVNTALPTVIRRDAARRGAHRQRRARGCNSPTTYLIQWQRAVGGDWATIPGAIGPSYLATPPTRGWPCAWS